MDGGKPWLIDKARSSSMVLGVGAKRAKEKIFLGNTIVFDSIGDFKEFSAFEKENVEDLGIAIKNSISNLIENYEGKFKAWVGYGPENYFLEFDTFYDHKLNTKLMEGLKE